MNQFDRFPELFNSPPYLKSPADVGTALEEWHHSDASELALTLPWILFWLVTEPDACNVELIQISMLVDRLNIDSIDGQFSINRLKLHDIEKINSRRMLDVYARLNVEQLTMVRDLILALKPIVGSIHEDEIDESAFVIDLLIAKRKVA